MRFREFMAEAVRSMRAGEYDAQHQGKVAPLPPTSHDTIDSLAIMKTINPYYGLYRLMMVAAGHPDRDIPISSVVGDVPIAMPYSEVDKDILIKSAKKMGASVTFVTSDESKEPKDTHIKSPVPHNSGKKGKKK